MEKRKNPESLIGKNLSKITSPLPVDFTKMVSEVLTNHYKKSLKLIEEETQQKASFSVTGTLFSDEIILSISIGNERAMGLTTLHVSSDFDPKASYPTAQEILNVCVDGAGGWLEEFLGDKTSTPEKREAVMGQSLSAFDVFENIPYDWAPVEVEKRRVFLKLDKSNPSLEEAADSWLKKNDPEYLAQIEEEEIATHSNFVTGEKARKQTKH